MIRALEQHGFTRVRQSGSHAIFRHPDGRRTTVPIHGKRDIGGGLLRQIMRDAGLTEADFGKPRLRAGPAACLWLRSWAAAACRVTGGRRTRLAPAGLSV
ncbi:MAG: type II toxin-antitoxin system HicA family toxin [Planctomycetota bacterium]